MNRQPERNIEDVEKINMLTAENKMLSARAEELGKTLELQNNYDQIKKDLLDAQQEVLELNKENELLLTEMETKDIELEEALIKVEMINLEIEEKYIGEEGMQEEIDDYKKEYQVLKKKLKVYFEITSEEKFGMEEKIEGLNNKLQELQAQKANVMESLEVQQEIKKRDNDIEELMKMIDSYKDSQKMIEMMTDKNNKLEEVTQKFQEDLANQKAVNESLEEELKENKEYTEEQETAIKDLEEEVKLYEEFQLEWEEKELNYEEMVLTLKEKIEGLEMERNELETDKFQNENEKEMYVNYLQDANKQNISAGETFKDTLLLKYQAKFWHFRSELQKLKLEILPTKVQNWLRLEAMENYELLEKNDIRLDCSVELLFQEYLLNFSLKDDSPNLYSNAKDLLLDLLNIKAYLTLCKDKFSQEEPQVEEETEDAEEKEEIEKFVDSDFYKEVMKNLPNIENLYLILTKGELSANYCMSHFAEAKFKLEEMISGFELNPKMRIMRVLTKGVQQMAAMSLEQGTNMEAKTKGIMMEIVSKTLKIFHNYEKIEGFQEEHIRKVETYEGEIK